MTKVRKLNPGLDAVGPSRPVWTGSALGVEPWLSAGWAGGGECSDYERWRARKTGKITQNCLASDLAGDSGEIKAIRATV
eukprot:scaffold344405_cov13-Prasinocladus_malaysianus.AAC.1